MSYRYKNNEIYKILRNGLTEGLQKRLRVQGTTISNLFEFQDEIEKLFVTDATPYSEQMLLEEQKAVQKLKDNLLNNLRNGKTYLKEGGIGLEHVVCKLMRCEGYDAKILSNRTFAGNDTDISAVKEDAFSLKKILVQVKHHSGFSGKEGIQQIIDVLAQPIYQDYSGYFITSADIAADARKLAEENGIDVMDGKGLVDLIVNDIDYLKDETKRELGIRTIPYII